MKFKLKNSCRYNLIAPSSMGVRNTPCDRQPLHTSRNYTLQAPSAETNVPKVVLHKTKD